MEHSEKDVNCIDLMILKRFAFPYSLKVNSSIRVRTLVAEGLARGHFPTNHRFLFADVFLCYSYSLKSYG